MEGEINNIQKQNTSTNLVNVENLKVEVYENFEDLINLQPEWDAFMESVDAEIFMTFDWCRIWWKYYGKKRKLAIFVFREDDRICAILPLFLETIRLGPVSVKAIRIVASDYMPVTVSIPIKKDFIDQVVKILVKRIESIWRWDIFYLGALSGKYPLTDQLVDAFKYTLGDYYCFEVKSKDVQTYYQVAKDWEHQVAGLATKIRNNVKRTYREINQNKTSVISALASEKDLPQMFDSFVQMHQNHWQQLGMPGHFGAWPASVDFHREMAITQLKLNRLRFIETKLDDQVVGYEYIYKLNRTYYLFLNARAEKRIRLRIGYKWIAFHETLEYALKDNVNCMDAMRGRYEYKIEMGGKYFPIKNLFIYSKRPTSLIRITFFRSLAWFFDICYSKLWNARIAPRLGIKRKVFWDNWIRFQPFSY